MVELHSLERKILLALKDGHELDVEEMMCRTGLSEAAVSRASLWLSSKGYLKVRETEFTFLQLDAEGQNFFENGLPERQLINELLKIGGKSTIEDLKTRSQLDDEVVNIAIGWARRKGWLKILKENDNVHLIITEEPPPDSDERLITLLGKGPQLVNQLPPPLLTALTHLKRRPKVILQNRQIERRFMITTAGLQVVQEAFEAPVSQLTSDLIQSGKWRRVSLRRYNIHAPVQKTWPGKKQAYKRFLDNLKWKLVALGFKEMEGPIVEFMFFNCDALFMPQDHPAREIHDIYYVKHPSYGDLSSSSELIKNVQAAHENGWKTGSKGWKYTFALKETERLVLRSQGTALSARMLVNDSLDIPGKYFSSTRCFRPDVVDRTHLTEFNQVEGIVLGTDLTFRDLLGVLELFATQIAGAEKVRFRPDYFPFTEPSVELAAYKEGAGWLEFGGAGMFRPEVTLPLGITVPVIAWGLGVERLFMMKTGINDIRELFTQDLDWLRQQRVM